MWQFSHARLNLAMNVLVLQLIVERSGGSSARCSNKFSLNFQSFEKFLKEIRLFGKSFEMKCGKLTDRTFHETNHVKDDVKNLSSLLFDRPLTLGNQLVNLPQQTLSSVIHALTFLNVFNNKLDFVFISFL